MGLLNNNLVRKLHVTKERFGFKFQKQWQHFSVQ